MTHSTPPTPLTDVLAHQRAANDRLRRELSARENRAELRALNASAREDAANDAQSIRVWLASGALRDATDRLRRFREGR